MASAWLIFYDNGTGAIDSAKKHEIVDDTKLSSNRGMIWVCSDDPDVADLDEATIKATWKVHTTNKNLIVV